MERPERLTGLAPMNDAGKTLTSNDLVTTFGVA
jgi:hypothetical protein